MFLKILAAGAALAALAAGGASAQTARSTGAVAGPKQPIPYTSLDAYLKASPKQRATKDWWSGSAAASTGMSSDTSATVPRAPADNATPSTSPADRPDSMTPSTPQTDRPETMMPSTPPTNTPDSTMPPSAGANMPGSTSKDPDTPPK